MRQASGYASVLFIFFPSHFIVRNLAKSDVMARVNQPLGKKRNTTSQIIFFEFLFPSKFSLTNLEKVLGPHFRINSLFLRK